MPSSAASAAIASALRDQARLVSVMALEMLGHVATIEHGADFERDLVLAVERMAFSLGHGADLGQRTASGREK